MGLRSIVFIVLFVLVAAFAGLNWAAFTATTTLSLGFGAVQAPLGLVMLAFSAALALVFLAFALYVQTAALLESRKQMKELRSQRELAEKAESSRITQLQQSLEAGFNRLAGLLEAYKAELTTHMERLQQEQAQHMTETGNGLSAAIGELEERLTNDRET